DASGLHRELAGAVRVDELRRREREGDPAGLAWIEADAAEAGELLRGTGDAGGVDPDVELHDRDTVTSAGVGDGRCDAEAATGVGHGIGIEAGQSKRGIAEPV